jgi:hypothetical protein
MRAGVQKDVQQDQCHPEREPMSDTAGELWQLAAGRRRGVWLGTQVPTRLVGACLVRGGGGRARGPVGLRRTLMWRCATATRDCLLCLCSNTLPGNVRR